MSIDQKPLDVDWLWDFIALAEHQHFSRAADARSIAQPAFSRHIRALEEWADVQLVDRNAHPAALTATFYDDTGTVLYSFTKSNPRAYKGFSVAATNMRRTLGIMGLLFLLGSTLLPCSERSNRLML
jgi:hypothetical protein